MMAKISETNPELIKNLFANQKGYQTPKVDVRGVVIEDDKVLMVREKTDGNWTLPGGWADVGLTPYENVIKEVWEESGLKVEPVRLLSVMDKKMYNHPPSPWYCYKIFVLCRRTGGMLQAGMEILETAFFSMDHLPQLSEERITSDQIKIILDLAVKEKVWCD
jgi:ADP-ribose pyrophosphatase YjhB (NUDIX family)